MIKRGVDIFFSLVGLVVLLPLYIVIAVVILVFNGWPIFFTQVRVGRGGRDFHLYKFRSMTVRQGTENGAFAPGETSRVTRFGKILRKSKLDEIPQLANVLIGDMSLIGPRPEVRTWVNACPDRWKTVLQVRPGISDPASIIYRDEESLLASHGDPIEAYRTEVLPKKLAIYEQYVANQSMLGDFVIFVQTLKVVTLGRSNRSNDTSRKFTP